MRGEGIRRRERGGRDKYNREMRGEKDERERGRTYDSTGQRCYSPNFTDE